MAFNQMEVLEEELERLLRWVGAAESRLAFVFSVSTAMLGAIALSVGDLGDWSWLSTAAALLAIVLLLSSIVCSVLATFPRIAGKARSLIFFGYIDSLSLDEYRKLVMSQTESGYRDDLIEQCHRNAQIASSKYAWIRRSMICIFLAAVPWAFALFTAYLG